MAALVEVAELVLVGLRGGGGVDVGICKGLWGLGFGGLGGCTVLSKILRLSLPPTFVLFLISQNLFEYSLKRIEMSSASSHMSFVANSRWIAANARRAAVCSAARAGKARL